MSMKTVTLYTVRIAGLLALLVGASIKLGLAVPLHAHLGLGGVTLAGFALLAFRSRRCPPILAALAALLLVPLYGLAQILPGLADLALLAPWLHPALAVLSIAAAEWTARRT
jgi:hypothetical protein